jgi:hypothetical protein
MLECYLGLRYERTVVLTSMPVFLIREDDKPLLIQFLMRRLTYFWYIYLYVFCFYSIVNDVFLFGWF